MKRPIERRRQRFNFKVFTNTQHLTSIPLNLLSRRGVRHLKKFYVYGNYAITCKYMFIKSIKKSSESLYRLILIFCLLFYCQNIFHSRYDQCTDMSHVGQNQLFVETWNSFLTRIFFWHWNNVLVQCYKTPIFFSSPLLHYTSMSQRRRMRFSQNVFTHIFCILQNIKNIRNNICFLISLNF